LRRQPVNESCKGSGPTAILPWRPVTVCNKGLAPGATFGSRPERRHRLSVWRALGHAPADLAAVAIAAAFTRATGKPPARDPERRASRAYSRDELGLALDELGYCASPPPPADPLALIWAAAIARVPWPSTRMLLLQQCRLLELRRDPSPLASRGGLIAVVAVRPGWFDMVRARVDLIGNGLNEALAACVAVEPVEVAE
jgi:hypothetical protein